jgi:DNA-binding NarL/FixJ family response regulator
LRRSYDRYACLLDPHPAWLDAVERVLLTINTGVVGKVTTAEDALELVRSEQPDVFVAEVAIGGSVDGITCLHRARELRPTLLMIVLSWLEDRATIDAALAAGAAAYVMKRAHPDDVASAIRQSFDPSFFLREATDVGAQSLTLSKKEDAPGLTRREVEILRLVAQGHSNAELAKKLWITEQTVKFHLSNIYRKLGASNRTEASRWAHLHGVLYDEASSG